MSEDLRCQIGLPQLAELAGVSPASLKKYFSQVYGVPISVYLRTMRMARAKELLSSTLCGSPISPMQWDMRTKENSVPPSGGRPA